MNVLGRDLEVEALARRVESMSPVEQARFWRSIAEDAVKVLTTERAHLRGAVSDVARARGLAEALAKCPDDHTVEGVREVGAEIAALLSRVGGQ